MKRLIAATVVLALLTGGVAFAASGGQETRAKLAGTRPEMTMRAGKELQALSRLTGMSLDEILAQLGVTSDQLRLELQKANRAEAVRRHRIGAVLVNLTGKSFDEIKALLKPGVNLERVLNHLGVTTEQLRTAMAEANRAEAQRHHRTVTALARLTGKSVDEIRLLIKPGVKLEEVLAQLGVTVDQLREAMQAQD